MDTRSARPSRMTDGGGVRWCTFAPAEIRPDCPRFVFSQPALPFPSVPSTPKSHHVARNAKPRLRLSNFSERNSCYKHQIYTDSHIAGEPEFCPLVLLRLAGRAHAAADRPIAVHVHSTIRAYGCAETVRAPRTSIWTNGGVDDGSIIH